MSFFSALRLFPRVVIFVSVVPMGLHLFVVAMPFLTQLGFSFFISGVPVLSLLGGDVSDVRQATITWWKIGLGFILG